MKWYIPEVGEKEAWKVHPGVMRVHVPDIFPVEVANAIRTKVRRNEITEHEALDVVQSIRALPITVLPAGPLLDRAMSLSCVSDLAMYDALYVALAERLGCPLITADGPMLRAGRIAASDVDIRALSS